MREWVKLHPQINLVLKERAPHPEARVPTWGARLEGLRASAPYPPLDSGSAMLSSERISASMPNFAAIAAAASIRLAANA
jgi:hypothetical protein